MVTLQNRISPKIIEKLRFQKENIISKEDIFHTLEEYQRIYKKKINILSIWTSIRKSKYIRRILNDYYYIYSLEERHHQYCKYSEEELIFLVLEKMNMLWYLGLERSLREHNVSWQTLNSIPIINTRFSGIKKLGSSRFKFIKTKEKRCRFGLLHKKTRNGVKYFYADLEKTYLDFLYFHSYQGKNINAIQKQLDFKIKMRIVKKYSKHYSEKVQKVR